MFEQDRSTCKNKFHANLHVTFAAVFVEEKFAKDYLRNLTRKLSAGNYPRILKLQKKNSHKSIIVVLFLTNIVVLIFLEKFTPKSAEN